MRVLTNLFLATVFFICIAAAMIAILNSPAVDTSENDTTESSSGPVVSIESPSGVSPAPRRAAAAAAPGPISAVPPLPGPPAAEPPVELEPVMQIRRQSVPVFSNNSAGGSILQLLDQGAQVETGLAVLNSEGLWVEVRLNQRPFGFVRGEDLGINTN